MTWTLWACLALGAILLASGCASRVAADGIDDGGLTDARASTTKPDAQLPTGPWRFVADDDGAASAAVALRGGAIDGDSATLEVAVRGVPQLQGVAFRLGYAPDRLTVARHQPSPAWSDPSVAEFAVRPEGQLWAGLGHVGAWGLAASDEVVVATLRVELSGAAPIALDFDAPRGLVLEAERGQPVSVAWLGGRFERIPR